MNFKSQVFNEYWFFAFFIVLSSNYAQAQKEGIYSAHVPELLPIWNRVADYSPVLRSVEAAEFSPDGKTCVSGSKFGYNLMVWRVADGHLLWQGQHVSEIECVSYSPDGKYIVSGDEDYKVYIWNAENGEIVKILEHDSGLDGLSFSSKGDVLAVGTEKGDLVYWSVSEWKKLKSVNCGSTINSVDFTSDDKYVVVAGNNQSKQPDGSTLYTGFVKAFQKDTLNLFQEYKGHTGSVKSVRVSTDDKFIATGSFDETTRIWELDSGKELLKIDEPVKIEAVEFSPDGNYLLTGGHDDKTRFYRTSDFSLAYELNIAPVEYFHFTKDGRLLLISHEDSGLLSLYMFKAQTQIKRGLYFELQNKQLSNRDMK